MNAMEHGNEYRRRRARVDSRASATAGSVCACRSPTSGDAGDLPEAETPDLEAKLAGLQTPARLGTVPDREDGRRDAA